MPRGDAGGFWGRRCPAPPRRERTGRHRGPRRRLRRRERHAPPRPEPTEPPPPTSCTSSSPARKSPSSPSAVISACPRRAPATGRGPRGPDEARRKSCATIQSGVNGPDSRCGGFDPRTLAPTAAAGSKCGGVRMERTILLSGRRAPRWLAEDRRTLPLKPEFTDLVAEPWITCSYRRSRRS